MINGKDFFNKNEEIILSSISVVTTLVVLISSVVYDLIQLYPAIVFCLTITLILNDIPKKIIEEYQVRKNVYQQTKDKIDEIDMR